MTTMLMSTACSHFPKDLRDNMNLNRLIEHALTTLDPLAVLSIFFIQRKKENKKRNL